MKDSGYWKGIPCPLVVSVQASPDSPLQDTDTLLRCAQASLQQGVEILRLEGEEAIITVKRETDARIIGLIKKRYPGSDVYITPTLKEVLRLLELPCDIVALDATLRERPGGETFADLAGVIRASGKTVMADCDTVEAAISAADAGADIVSSTLSGYTASTSGTGGPDLGFIRECRLLLNARNATGSNQPLLFAEGRFTEPWQVEAALRCGADAVVVGGAVNDPVKNTRRLMPSPTIAGPVAAIDIGGTWLRIAQAFPPEAHSESNFGPIRTLLRATLPRTRKERMDLISETLRSNKFSRVGICTGGIVRGNMITISKPSIPENVGTDYNLLKAHLAGDDPVGVVALGDGVASAWAHACHPDFAGKNVAVLALGTGVGFGYVREGKIMVGPDGEYTRVNDTHSPNGKTFEEIFGGAALTPNPTLDQQAEAKAALQNALRMIGTFLFPDVIVLCGTVGMQDWLETDVPHKNGWPDIPVVKSSFGADAGLYGAAALALYPPQLSS